MRTVVLTLLVALAASTFVLAAEPAPRPREACTDPRRPARLEWFRTDAEPVLRGLARYQIIAGDPVEPIIKANPHYEVFRAGEYVVLSFEPGQGGTRLMAKDGKLVGAWTSSCIYHETFFDSMTDDERGAGWTAFDAERQKLLNGKLTLPAVAGAAASFGVLRRPAVPKH